MSKRVVYEINVMVTCAGNIPSHLFYIPHVSTFKSWQYAGCLSHEPSLMALAPTSCPVAQW